MIATRRRAAGLQLAVRDRRARKETTAETLQAVFSFTHAGRSGPNFLSVTNADTLIAAAEKEGVECEKPAEAVTDKVGFLFNNLSQSNLQAKTEEMRTLLAENGESFMKWLAQYIVIKRVAIEPNFQPLYNLFLQSLKDTTFDQFVKIETLRNIKVILRSDKREAATNYSDRTLLKNLGMWLGLITIGRSKPILVPELDLKSLLLEAYYKGQEELLFVIPFVAKIVCSSAKSQVFSPYSSWIRSILKIFAELHTEPDLKINLKFEIEVLFKELNIDLQEMMHYVDDVLKDTDRLLSVKQQLSDLRTLQQPVITSSSPIPQAMRGTGTSSTPSLQEIGSPLGNNETKASSFVQGPIDINEPMEPMATPPSYSYFDINVVSYEGITSHLKIPTHHPLFQMYPTLKGFVKPAVIQAIKELLGPVNDKALKTASTATEHLTKKDFGLCGDDMQMRRAGINIMRAVTGAMVHVSIREPMQSTLASYLHQSLNNGLRNLGAQGDPKLVEEAVAVITVENLELAMDFVVKTACEKSAPELDRKMEAEYQLRQSIKREGKEFTGAEDLIFAQSMLPEALRIGAGPIPKEQMGAYEEYSTRICGFKPFASDEVLPVHPMVVKDNFTSGISIDLRGQGESENFGKTFHFLSNECESYIARGSVFPSLSKVVQALVIFRDNLRQLAFEPSQPLVLRNTLVQAIEQFLNAYTPSSHSIKEEVEVINRLHELTLAFIRMLVMKIPLNDISARVTNILTSSQGDYRFNFEAVEQLVRNHLILFDVYDRWLGEMIESGQNAFAPIFAQRLVRLVSSRGITEAQIREKFPLTFDQLLKLQSISGVTRSATENQGGTGTQNSLIGIYFGDRVMQNPNLPITDVQGADGELQSKVEEILREWISLCYTPAALKDPQQALATIIHMMHEHGVLATDDMITRFFRLCTEMCVDVSYRLLKDETASNSQTIIRQRCYYTLDAFVKLTCLMVRFSDGSQAHTKVNLFRKVLNIVTSVLMLDHEVRRAEFHPMPYHRILIIMFIELTDMDDPSLEPIFGSIVDTFVNALFVVQPRRAPRFALAWLDLVGHRYTISRLIVPAYICSGAPTPDALNAAAMYTQLLICQLKFLSPYLRNIDLPKSVALLYRGTLRVLLVILHDFPELLCEFHFVLCDTIPPNCIQLRNLVLSAYPKHMKLPDPFTLNFKQIDALPEMMFEPKMNLSMTSVIPSELLQQLEGYLSTRIGVDLLSSLPTLLTVSHTAGSRYNTTILHAIVLYVGSRAVEVLQSKGQRISMTTIAHTSFMDIFQNLAVRLCTEGRYLLFNAIANQLRYPNAHTHYFSCTLLFLFFQADMNVMKEQITRVLFERLVALRPHPWGLLITFIELIRNPIYRFWDHDFTKCTPEIERLFRNVASTCISTQRQDLQEGVPAMP